MAADEYGIPASGTVADCSHAPILMEDLEAEAFPADKAHDTNELPGMLKEADMAAVIPPVKSRKSRECTMMKKKFSDTNSAIKNRCRAVVSQFHELLKKDNTEIRRNVSFYFEDREPNID